MWGLLLSIFDWLGLSPTPFIAESVGATDPAIKLFLSILMGYPIGSFYHKYVMDKSSSIRNLYFVVTGLDMAWYNFGTTMYHNAVPAIFMYFSTLIFGASKANCIVTFAFNMTYLLVGYVLTESEDYDITWTMPHCVLTLKLIALSFDLWDGEKMKNGEELSANNKKTAIVVTPTLPEIIGFVYFPACFLVGPIFSFKRYHDFIEDKYPLETNKEVFINQAFKKLLQGVLYVLAHQIGVAIFNVKYMQSDEFWERSIFYRHLYVGLWAHFALYKYISCWLLTEGACIRIGLSYNGEVKIDGQIVSKFDGCNNIKLMRFETATKFHHYVESFNCNTNFFAAEYIYKRLKFLGSREASQLCTLVFLAIWHGIKSGYYITFLNEFIIILMEKELEPILNRYQFYHTMWDNAFCKYILYGLLKLYTIVFMGWSLVPFDLKIYTRWLPVYTSLYFSGFIIFIPWALLWKPSLLWLFRYFRLMKIKQ